MGPVNLYMELYNQKSNSIKWYFKVPSEHQDTNTKQNTKTNLRTKSSKAKQNWRPGNQREKHAKLRDREENVHHGKNTVMHFQERGGGVSGRSRGTTATP